ncbi:MAG: FAD:protein FMN transferase [Planctomycetales bacterium]|nr:FAD:protein FMN transferase [Planctomycetales bacterium]
MRAKNENERIACRYMLWLFVLLLASAAASANDRPLSITGATMGTTYSVKIGTASPGLDPLSGVVTENGRSSIDVLHELIDERLAEIDQRMSTYKVDSEVTIFNSSKSEDWFPVSAETATVVNRALEISAQTNGAFDITVGPLVRLWNFGAGSKANPTVPTGTEIERTQSQTGYSNLDVRLEPPALRKRIPTLEIDLSGIGKGYAVDQIASLLETHRISDYLVEIGGEIRVSGQPAHRSGQANWSLGIEAPRSDTRSVSQVLALTNQAMASSGDYRNFFEVDGVRYSHTIDPRTGRPVQHQFAASTILASDCATADALATAILVMGPNAMEFCNSNGVPALLFERTADLRSISFNSHTSDVFPVDQLRSLSESTAPDFAHILAASIIVIGIAIVGMGIGVIFRNRCIKGSCGGMEGLTDEHGRPLCEGCSNPSPECTNDPTLQQQQPAN